MRLPTDYRRLLQRTKSPSSTVQDSPAGVKVCVDAPHTAGIPSASNIAPSLLVHLRYLPSGCANHHSYSPGSGIGRWPEATIAKRNVSAIAGAVGRNLQPT